jgi:hypothetical protein
MSTSTIDQEDNTDDELSRPRRRSRFVWVGLGVTLGVAMAVAPR